MITSVCGDTDIFETQYVQREGRTCSMFRSRLEEQCMPLRVSDVMRIDDDASHEGRKPPPSPGVIFLPVAA